MSQKTAYDYSNEELVREFWVTCAKAGVSNSGLVIDVGAGSHMEQAQYMGGIVLSRLEGKTLPFKRGDVVRAKPEIKLVYPHQYWGSEIGSGRSYEVKRVHYYVGGKWFLEFYGVRGERGAPHYNAENFELVEAAISAPAPV